MERKFGRMWLLLLVAACSAVGGSAGQLVNLRVTREVNLNTELPRVTTRFTVRNTGSREVKQIDFLVPPSFQTVLKVADSEGATLSLTHGSETDGYQTRSADLLLEAGSSIDLVLYQVEFGSIQNVPASIALGESQYLRYSGGYFFYSPYETLTQSTEVSLPSSTVTSVSDGPGDVVTKAKKMLMGPYANIAKMTQQPFVIRYKYLTGMLVAESIHKHVAVSHWGNMRVEETYVMKNPGPKADFEYRRDDPGFAMPQVSRVSAKLPKTATDVQYRDAVGNITSSGLRKPTDTSRLLGLQFRYPLFGGWRTTFTYSYNIPLVPYIKPFGGKYYQLRVNFEPTLNPIPATSDFLLTIVLPEGASEISVELPAGLSFESQTNSTVYPTLSITGSKSLSFSRQNFVAGYYGTKMLLVEYRYSNLEQIRVPLVLSGCLAAFFAAVIAAGRLAESTKTKLS